MILQKKILSSLCLALILLFNLATFAMAAETTTERQADLEVSRVAEKNGLADTLCIIVRWGSGIGGKVIGATVIIFVGISWSRGNGDPKALVSIVIFVAIFTNGDSIVRLFVPGTKLKGGCDCKGYSEVGRFTTPDGKVVQMKHDLKLNADCSEKT